MKPKWLVNPEWDRNDYTYIYIYIHVFNEEIYRCCEHIAKIYSIHVLIWSVECDAPGQAAHGLDPSNKHV